MGNKSKNPPVPLSLPDRYGYTNKDKESVKVLSAFGYPCPTVSTFCFCIPLTIGSYIIAGLGIFPTIACLILASPPGMDMVLENGLPEWYSPGIDWIYGILGVFVFITHLILFVALIKHKRPLIILYLWSMFAYMAGSFGAALIISAETIKSGHGRFGWTFMLLAAIYTLILFYFWIVINSQLYVEKKELNVVNIHITII